jgi:hypothetical protein
MWQIVTTELTGRNEFASGGLLLVVQQGEDRLESTGGKSECDIKHSPVVIDRGYFGTVLLKSARRQQCRYRIVHSPAMNLTLVSSVAKCDGSFEGRRFESCHG